MKKLSGQPMNVNFGPEFPIGGSRYAASIGIVNGDRRKVVLAIKIHLRRARQDTGQQVRLAF
jgi:hypothetical protein